jgi:hypothetical protein
MKIFYTRGNKKAEIPVYGPCTLKIYQVPAAYSKDELFAALWSPGELEPLPACGHAEAALLAHVSLALGESGTLALAEHHIAEGEVRYG